MSRFNSTSLFSHEIYLFGLERNMMLGSSSSANSPPNEFDLNIVKYKNTLLLAAIAFLYSLLVLISLTSNPILIYVLLWRRKAQIKLIDIFVANLSLSDLFLTIFNIPLCLIIYFSEQWPFGSLVCQLGTYSTSCSIYVNIFTMAYISIDRYFAVTRISNPNCAALRTNKSHLDGTTKRKIYSVLTFIWIVALILSLPQFLFSKVSSQKSSSSSNQLVVENVQLPDNIRTTGFDDELYDEQLHNNHSYLKQLSSGASMQTSDELLLLNVDDIVASSEQGDFGEDPFKRCILEYPLKNMKNYMILINFSLQYLIPSVVILYFYGRIIYHLYLNLNIEDLMDLAYEKSLRQQQQKDSSARSSNQSRTAARKLLSRTSKASRKQSRKQSSLVRKRSAMRVDGINRERNLKKSIKLMIIIIVLFLLSWLPIHLYRLVTTFYPLVASFVNDLTIRRTGDEASKLWSNSSSSSPSLMTVSTNYERQIDMCKQNISSKECLVFALREIKDFSDKASSFSLRLNTLHNRYAFLVAYFMAMSSVCYNPIVYFWMHKKFRAEVGQILARLLRLVTLSTRPTTNNNNNNTKTTAQFTSTSGSVLYKNNNRRNTTVNTSLQVNNNKAAIHDRSKSCQPAFHQDNTLLVDCMHIASVDNHQP